MSLSRVFGSVAILVSLYSFFLAYQGTSSPELFRVLVTWGGLFLVLGIALWCFNRFFGA